MEKERALIDLLESLFSAEELRAHLVKHMDSEVVAALPGSTVSLDALATDTVSLLSRRGFLDAAFFDRLEKIRGKRRDDIRRVRALWVEETAAALARPSEPPVRTAPRGARGWWLSAALALLAGVGAAAVYSFARPACGDGAVDDGEDCDDGNRDDTDACTSRCRVARCGDGLVQAGVEVCDDGDQDGADECAGCLPAICGDGFVHPTREVCDRGENDGAYEGCEPGCKGLGPRCGDGVVDAAFEVCDRGENDGAYEGCEPGCKGLGPYCGDKTVDVGFGEVCDDGDADDADGCTSRCRSAACGEGLVKKSREDCEGLDSAAAAVCLIACKSAEKRVVRKTMKTIVQQLGDVKDALIRGCNKEAGLTSATVQVKLTIDDKGRVQVVSASVLQPKTGTARKDCLVAALKRRTFTACTGGDCGVSEKFVFPGT